MEELEEGAKESTNVSSTSSPASSRREGLQAKEGPGRGKATPTQLSTSEDILVCSRWKPAPHVRG